MILLDGKLCSWKWEILSLWQWVFMMLLVATSPSAVSSSFLSEGNKPFNCVTTWKLQSTASLKNFSNAESVHKFTFHIPPWIWLKYAVNPGLEGCPACIYLKAGRIDRSMHRFNVQSKTVVLHDATVLLHNEVSKGENVTQTTCFCACVSFQPCIILFENRLSHKLLLYHPHRTVTRPLDVI